MKFEDKSKHEKVELKKIMPKVYCAIGFVMILLPIFFNSYFEYEGNNPALQFIFAALPYILIGIGFLFVLIPETQKKISDDNKKEEERR